MRDYRTASGKKTSPAQGALPAAAQVAEHELDKLRVLTPHAFTGRMCAASRALESGRKDPLRFGAPGSSPRRRRARRTASTLGLRTRGSPCRKKLPFDRQTRFLNCGCAYIPRASVWSLPGGFIGRTERAPCCHMASSSFAAARKRANSSPLLI